MAVMVATVVMEIKEAKALKARLEHLEIKALKDQVEVKALKDQVEVKGLQVTTRKVEIDRVAGIADGYAKKLPTRLITEEIIIGHRRHRPELLQYP